MQMAESLPYHGQDAPTGFRTLCGAYGNTYGLAPDPVGRVYSHQDMRFDVILRLLDRMWPGFETTIKTRVGGYCQ